MKINAIILAAGLGKRLAPLTDHLPKPVLPVGGVPLLHTIINKLKDAGVAQIAVNTHHLPAEIQKCVAASPHAADITLYHEDVLLDTAGPLVNAGKLLSNCDHFLLHNGDIYTDFDIVPMLQQHIATGAVMTMAVLQGPENRLHVQHNRIVDVKDLLGVQYTPESQKYTYACVAVFSRDFFRFLPETPVPCHFYEAWTKALQSGALLSPYYIPEGSTWNDIGSCGQYFAANCMAAKGGNFFMPGAGVAEEAILTGFNIIGTGAEIAAGAKLHNCIVLNDAKVPAARWSNQVIGKDFVCHRDERELRSRARFGGQAEDMEFSSLEEQGSSRRFYRVKDGEDTKILMLSDASDKDFGHFVKLGNFFSRNNMFTPAIYRVNTEEYSVLMEDLGDNVLFRHLQKCDKKHLLKHYREVLHTLVQFQEHGRNAIASEDREYRLFNRKVLLWESDYFSENFLNRLCGLDFDSEFAENLRRETAQIAFAAERMPVAVMHRDFQSQNIVLQDGRVRFVDFQGSRLGPYTYDAASLIKDPYTDLPKDLRDELYDIFYEELQKAGFHVPLQEFRYHCLLGALQRNMQALGAYGFLALTKGKIHYLDYAPPCLRLLQEGLAEFSLVSPFPTGNLQKACQMAGEVLTAKISAHYEKHNRF